MKRLRRLLWCALAACLAGALAWGFLPEPPPPLEGIPWSPLILDRAGHVLRLGLTADEKYRLRTPLAAISPEEIAATLCQEDQHFYRHPGINPWSTLRACAYWCAGRHGRGGASTITMQLARLRYGLRTRTFRGKCTQMLRALELERYYSKAEILEAYLNLAPYGGNVEGIGAASLLYYEKRPAGLTRAEAAVLSVLPQSPTRRAPRAHGANLTLQAAALRLGARLSLPGAAVPLPRPHPWTAPHFVQHLLAQPAGGEIRTTLDTGLQHLLERRAATWLEAHRRLGIANAAALLVDTRSMDVLAQVGSADFFDVEISGQVDGTRCRRSPGSALKPFIYALAMDQGLIHPHSMLTDAPRRFGSYAPENFDGDFAGPIRASEALVRSRNVPAVALADRLTRPTFYQFLRRSGVALPYEESHYGLSLALGGGEVTMEELVRLYAALAQGGRLRPLRRTLAEPEIPGLRILSPESSFLTLEMLSHLPRPDLDREAGADGVSWKTGTSMGFRDAWSIAVFDHYVLAVWVGNFDGTRNPAFIGRTCAGPLLFQIIDAMRAGNPARPRPLEPPPGANLRQVELCAVSGQLPTAACTHRTLGWFIPGISPIAACTVHREVLIDRASGLRVSTDDGTRELRREVFEFWPSDLLALFEKAGLPRRRPPPFAPGCGVELSARSGARPVIVSPTPGRTYAVRIGDPGAIVPLLARTEADVTRLYWFAGRTYLGASTPRQALPWHATPGQYHLTALDDHGRSVTSTITLEAAGL